jgi:hypothetical protein
LAIAFFNVAGVFESTRHLLVFSIASSNVTDCRRLWRAHEKNIFGLCATTHHPWWMRQGALKEAIAAAFAYPLWFDRTTAFPRALLDNGSCLAFLAIYGRRA